MPGGRVVPGERGREKGKMGEDMGGGKKERVKTAGAPY